MKKTWITYVRAESLSLKCPRGIALPFEIYAKWTDFDEWLSELGPEGRRWFLLLVCEAES